MFKMDAQEQLRQVKRRRIQLISDRAALDMEDLNLEHQQSTLEGILFQSRDLTPRLGTSLIRDNVLTNMSPDRRSEVGINAEGSVIQTTELTRSSISDNKVGDSDPADGHIYKIKPETVSHHEPLAEVVTIPDDDHNCDKDVDIILDHKNGAQRSLLNNSSLLGRQSSITDPILLIDDDEVGNAEVRNSRRTVALPRQESSISDTIALLSPTPTPQPRSQRVLVVSFKFWMRRRLFRLLVLSNERKQLVVPRILPDCKNPPAGQTQTAAASPHFSVSGILVAANGSVEARKLERDTDARKSKAVNNAPLSYADPLRSAIEFEEPVPRRRQTRQISAQLISAIEGDAQGVDTLGISNVLEDSRSYYSTSEASSACSATLSRKRRGFNDRPSPRYVARSPHLSFLTTSLSLKTPLSHLAVPLASPSPLPCPCQDRSPDCRLCRGTPAVIAEGHDRESSLFTDTVDSCKGEGHDDEEIGNCKRRRKLRYRSANTSYKVPDLFEESEQMELEMKLCRRMVESLKMILERQPPVSPSIFLSRNSPPASFLPRNATSIWTSQGFGNCHLADVNAESTSSLDLSIATTMMTAGDTNACSDSRNQTWMNILSLQAKQNGTVSDLLHQVQSLVFHDPIVIYDDDDDGENHNDDEADAAARSLNQHESNPDAPFPTCHNLPTFTAYVNIIIRNAEERHTCHEDGCHDLGIAAASTSSSSSSSTDDKPNQASTPTVYARNQEADEGQREHCWLKGLKRWFKDRFDDCDRCIEECWSEVDQDGRRRVVERLEFGTR